MKDPDPVALSEIATMAGESKQTVWNWVARYKDFPKPIADLAMGRIWEKSEIQSWLEHKQKPARELHER